MRYAVTCEGIEIGHSALETRGAPRGVVRGAFVPTAAYERLRPLFRAEALWHELVRDATGERLVAEAERARSRLRFALHDERGARTDVAHLYVGESDGGDRALQVIAFLAAAAPAAAAVAVPDARIVAPPRAVDGLAVSWVRADGSVVETLAAPGLEPGVLALAPASGACPRFVDPAGRTVFNRLQVPWLVEELRYARAVADAPELRRNAEWVLRFLARPAGAAGCELWVEARSR